MKINILILISLMLFAVSVNAQQGDDLLYLKNGSVIKGSLLEASGDRYKIQTSDGSLFVYNVNEVEKFIKSGSDITIEPRERIGLGLEAGFLVGSQLSEYVAPFSFGVMLNFRPTERHSLGGVSGVEFLGASYMPLLFEYRYQLKTGQVSPVLFFRGGWMASLGGNSSDDSTNDIYYSGYDRKYSGGPTFAIGTGVVWHKANYDINLGFAYRYARTSYEEKGYNSYPVTYETNWRRLEVKLGFGF